jgi:hypothetical protein
VDDSLADALICWQPCMLQKPSPLQGDRGVAVAERADVSKWLRERTPQHLALLDKMRGALTDKFPVGIAGEPLIPDRDWARVYGLYQAGFHALLTEERERAKLALMARLKSEGKELSDEEFEAGIRNLAIHALKELSTADLAQELMRRGLTLPSVPVDGDAQ